MKYTITSPHPDHRPTVGRISTGSRPIGGGRTFGTTLRCSCGWALRAHHTRVRQDDGTWKNVDRPDYKVSNSPPSSTQGRQAARDAYEQHMAGVGL